MKRIVQLEGSDEVRWRCDACLRMVYMENRPNGLDMLHAEDDSEVCDLPRDIKDQPWRMIPEVKP